MIMRIVTWKITFLCFFYQILQILGIPALQQEWEPNVFAITFTKEAPQLRLPKNLIPENYTLEIQPIIETAPFGQRFTCPGKIWMFVVCKRTTAMIKFHVNGPTILPQTVKVYNKNTNIEVKIVRQNYEPESHFYVLRLQDPLQVYNEYIIYVEFIAKIALDSMSGFYMSTYKDEQGIKLLAATHFEPMFARKAFPCFDEIQLKAQWEIRIIRPRKYSSLSNTQIQSTHAIQNMPGWEVDIYEKTLPMSSYLVAYVLSDFKFRNASDGFFRLPVTIWASPPLIKQGAADFASNFSARVMDAYEKYFKVEYTFAKMDEIALPTFMAGAMENWGLNTYRESRLLWLNGVSTFADLCHLTSTVSHELAHQWFGNLVTPHWWTDVWLKEGFANYFGPIMAHEVFPILGLKDTFINSGIQSAMEYDESPDTHPMHATNTNGKIYFDTVMYNKAGSVIRMMRQILGEKAFRKGLHIYLMRNAYSVATKEDLFAALESALPKKSRVLDNMSFKEIMDTWTNQSGYPVVTAIRDYTGMVTLKQKKFTSLYDKNKENDLKWTIPIFKSMEGDPVNQTVKLLTWFKASAPSLEIPDFNDTLKFYIINPQQSGFYRVIYDEDNFQKIKNKLMTNPGEIHVLTRSAILDDAFDLAFSGHITLSQGLDVTRYLTKERHLVPWTTFFNNMAHSKRMLFPTAIFPYFRKYVLNLIKGPLAELGFYTRETDVAHIGNTIILRSKFMDWSCSLQCPFCVQFALTNMAQWMKTPSMPSVVVPDLQGIVYCTAVANGEDRIWDFVFHQYKLFNRLLYPDNMFVNLIRAMACTKDSLKLQWMLDQVLDVQITNNIRAEHRLVALQSIAGNSAGTDITFRFVRINMAFLIQKYSLEGYVLVIQTLSTLLNNYNDMEEMKQFIESQSNIFSTVPDIKNSLRVISNNMLWMDEHYRNYTLWLTSLPVAVIGV